MVKQLAACWGADGKGRATSRFIKTVSLKWQIRYDCGDLDALPDRAGLRTLHHLLALPRGESLTPEEAMVIEPKHEKLDSDEVTVLIDTDPVAEFFESQGIEWSALSLPEQD